MIRILVSLVCAFVSCLATSGCQRPDGVQVGNANVALTPSPTRAARRMYDGAPPVIPHPPLGAACQSCHTPTGSVAPPLGMAPANPHSKTAHLGASSNSNCRQCHVFATVQTVFRGNQFAGIAQTLADAERLYPTAPPVIPHPVFMREDCRACHGGVAARPEIRCDHLDRTHCRQCHVSGDRPQTFTSALSLRPELKGAPEAQ